MKRMKANYHTHTWRCKHAVGEERQYVENAIKGGIQILGFSDHTPMPYKGGYVSPSKMSLDELEGYVDTVLSLKQEYASDIEIHLGLEVEYYPAYFEDLLRFCEDYPIEYFLLAQHFLGNEIGEVFSGNVTHEKQSLTRYVDQCIEAMETGRFTYLAHPDLLNYQGDDAFYQAEMRRLCQGAKRLDVPLEINFLGIWDHRHYPHPLFWPLAAEEGNTVIFGSDAHRPDKVYNPEAEKVALSMVEKYHLPLLTEISFVSPFAERTSK